jgi:ApeA N-terminal domain 1
MYLEQRFLNMVQAAESYHRRRRSNEVLPKSEHRERVQRIVSTAPEGDRSWLKEQLTYSNEPRLRDWLADLVALTEPVMMPLIGDVHKFVRLVTNTRNYHTHYDRRLLSKSAQGPDLYELTSQLGRRREIRRRRDRVKKPKRNRPLKKAMARR